MLQRLQLLATLIVLACSASPEGHPAEAAGEGETRPNVVYVMSDELAYFE